MRQPPDPYRELGVPHGATDEQIKAAHRRLAKRFHPDASSGERERFMAVQEAYLLLTDPLRRREWDVRNAPGPVRAPSGPPRGAPMARSRRGTPPRPDVTGTTARTSHGTTRGSSASARSTAAQPPREPGTQAYTWSAAGVPWWEDFQPKGAPAGGPGDAPPPPPPPPTSAGPPSGPPERPPDADPFSRSSGTAWSSAARSYFRQGDAELPRGGQFRYRGTQVVTGAEARRAADEELRRRRVAPEGPAGPPTPSRAARDPTRQSGLLARLRRLFGGS